MKNNLQIFPNLPQQDFQELYRQVLSQIKKDFYPHASLDKAPEQLSPLWLFDQIKIMLQYIIENDSNALGNIIYRVDISEKTMRKSITGVLQKDKLDKLAMMILEREAQKVWIRNHYKSQKS